MHGKINKYVKLFFLSLILSSCFNKNTDMRDQINISIKVVDSYTKLPRINDTVKIRRAKWGIPMRRYVKIGQYITNSSGIVKVTLSKKERYSFSTYGSKYANGSTEYGEEELNDNDQIIIEVIPPTNDSTLLVPSQKHTKRKNW